MHCSKFAGVFAVPVFSFLMFAATVRAQTPSGPDEKAPSASSSAATPSAAADFALLSAPVSAAHAFSSSVPDEASSAQDNQQDNAQNPPPAPTEAQRAELARQAQARVRARRQQRIAAIVQDTYSHKYEIFGGVGYLRLRPGADLQKVSVFGFDAGVTKYLNNNLGITVDGRGYFGNAYVGNLDTGINFYEPSVSSYSISGGPQYRFYMRQKWSVSGVAMVGVARDVFYGNSQGLPGTLLGLYPNQWRLTATLGAPLDYNLGPGLAFRVTPNYYPTNWGGQIQNNLGFTGGINYRFGRR